MKIALIAFTKNGGDICRKIYETLVWDGHDCSAYSMGQNAGMESLIPIEESLSAWARDAFDHSDALIFVGAAGIAVRAVAPYIKNKTVDPAVIVVDEKGKYVIPILSGHIGGANRLAARLSEITGGVPVITTATDINEKFAVDVWAAEQGLFIESMKAAKQISSDILAGNPIFCYSQYPLEGQYPKGVTKIERDEAIAISQGESQAGRKEGIKEQPGADSKKIAQGSCMVISHEDWPKADHVLQLIPKSVYVGMGCRRGISPLVAEEFLRNILGKYNIRAEAIALIASIDLKKDEIAICKLAEKLDVPLITYSAEELLSVQGDFTASQFVEKVTGVNNVCERAAIAGSRGGHLILRKEAGGGVTVALAMNRPTFSFK